MMEGPPNQLRTWQGDGLPSASPDLAKGTEFDAMRARMEALCATHGTLATDTPDDLEV